MSEPLTGSLFFAYFPPPVHEGRIADADDDLDHTAHGGQGDAFPEGVDAPQGQQHEQEVFRAVAQDGADVVAQPQVLLGAAAHGLEQVDVRQVGQKHHQHAGGGDPELDGEQGFHGVVDHVHFGGDEEQAHLGGGDEQQVRDQGDVHGPAALFQPEALRQNVGGQEQGGEQYTAQVDVQSEQGNDFGDQQVGKYGGDADPGEQACFAEEAGDHHHGGEGGRDGHEKQ